MDSATTIRFVCMDVRLKGSVNNLIKCNLKTAFFYVGLKRKDEERKYV